MIIYESIKNGNDPYAGSPTNTLLRLLLPLNDPVWASFRYKPNDRSRSENQAEDLTKTFNR